MNRKGGKGGFITNVCTSWHITMDAYSISKDLFYFESGSSGTSLCERPFLRKSKTSHDTVTVVVAQTTLEKKKHTQTGVRHKT